MTLVIFTTSLQGKNYYYPLLTNEKTETQNGYTTFLSSYM